MEDMEDLGDKEDMEDMEDMEDYLWHKLSPAPEAPLLPF
jgi:hypothetical protein